jgi:DNA-binding transcriptional ArsR family regulator
MRPEVHAAHTEVYEQQEADADPHQGEGAQIDAEELPEPGRAVERARHRAQYVHGAQGEPTPVALDSGLYFYIIRNMDIKATIDALGALAQETRLSLFRLLVQAGPEGLAAGTAGERLGVPAPTLSFHLAQLRHAGLIVCRREGRSLIYAADFASMNALVAFLMESCCQGSAEVCAPIACAPATPARVTPRKRRAR